MSHLSKQSFEVGFSAEMRQSFSGSEPIMVGISGGVDSVVLLDLIVSLYDSRVVVCHIHHGLRGEEADRDEALVKSLAEKYQVPFLSVKVDVKALSEKWSVSVETAGRIFRYEQFETWGKRLGTRLLVLAHHADDQAETVLFNLCRGSVGLKGIKDIVQRGSLLIIRPLLNYRKKEIKNYAQIMGLIWGEDSTNQEDDVARNIIRLKVIPELSRALGRDVVPKLVESVTMAQLGDRAIKEAIRFFDVKDPQGRLFLPKVSIMPEALRWAILYDYLNFCGVKDLSSELVARADKLITDFKVAKINLPGNRYLRRKEKRLIVE